MIGPTNATAVYAQIDPSIATNVGSATQPVFVSNSTIVPANTMVDTSTAQTIIGTKTFYSGNFSDIRIKSNRNSGNLGGVSVWDNADTMLAQFFVNKSGEFIIRNYGATKAVKCQDQRAYDAANIEDVATIGTLDAYSPMLRTTGDQTALGTKRMWTVTYRGAITASNADAGTYTVLADLGVAIGQSGVHVGLSIMGRTGGFDGFISITSDENGILTATAVGTNVGGTATTIGACYDPNNNNEMYLVARRLTSAGQSFIVNIKGIEHGTSITVPTPTETAPVLTGITNYLEALKI